MCQYQCSVCQVAFKTNISLEENGEKVCVECIKKDGFNKKIGRAEKEILICEAWEHFRTNVDEIEMPYLPSLTNEQIDAMFGYFKFCYQEENSDR